MLCSVVIAHTKLGSVPKQITFISEQINLEKCREPCISRHFDRQYTTSVMPV